MERYEIELYEHAEYKWGSEKLRLAFFEEIGEAMTALSHLDRGRCKPVDVVNEMIDVIMMAEQMIIVYGDDIDYESIKIKALKKLESKLR